MPMRAFISYKRTGKVLDKKVTEFHDLLQSELKQLEPQASVFLDTQNMGAGDVFPDVLQGEVESSDVLIVLLSPAWLRSDWCRKEYELFAAKEHKSDITPRACLCYGLKRRS